MNNHFFEQKDCGLQAFWSSTPQFKTARVSAHLVLPLTTPENAALYALVPNMISRATREYPDYTQFGQAPCGAVRRFGAAGCNACGR